MTASTMPQDQLTRMENLVLELKKAFKQHCKSWAFQVEVAPTTLGLHMQCRFSLNSKMRLNGAKAILPESLMSKAHLSPTSRDNSSNVHYVVKKDSRFYGPFSDKDRSMPRQLRPFQNQLLPWQASVRSLLLHFDPRVIHVVVTEGNIGKTSLVGLMLVKGEAAYVPLMSSYKDLMRAVMSQDHADAYLVDIPRALPVGNELYAASETLKSGYAFDDRYSFKWRLCDSPGICFFTNHEPNHDFLSEDRWIIWNVIDNRLVLKYGTPHEYFHDYITNPVVDCYSH